MPLVPYCVRVETADDLEAALNTALAPLLAHQIISVEVDQAKPGPFFTKNIFCAFSTLPGTAFPTPFQAKVFSAPDESQLLASIVNFITANPTYFFSGIFVFYRTESPNPENGVSGVIFYNATAAAAVNWQPSASGGGTTYDVQVFTSTGIWTKPANAVETTAEVFGAGAGGGGGRQGAAGSNRSGGGGGGGGGYNRRTFQASDLGATETVIVGAPGLGGLGGGLDTNGSPGTAGGGSSFGTTPLVSATGGSQGSGGDTSSGTEGNAGLPNGAKGGRGSTAAGFDSEISGTGSLNGGGGGGAGGGLNTSNTQRNGGTGLAVPGTNPAATGVRGLAPNGNGSNGIAQGAPNISGPGGGGGASGPAKGGDGGDGATPAGGGGGGAAGVNGSGAGDGGDGGAGLVIVTTLLGSV